MPALLAAAPDTTFLLYADSKRPLELTPAANAVLRTMPWRQQASSIWNDYTLGRWMAKDGVEVTGVPTNYGFGPASAASVVTVHDAINLLPLRHSLFVRGHRATLRTSLMTVYLHRATVRAVRRATRLVTMSNYSRETIVAACSRRADRDRRRAPRCTARRAPHARGGGTRRCDRGITSRYVLADGLKNPGVVLRAAARLAPEVRRAHTFVFFARHAQVLPVLSDAVAAGQGRLLVRPSTDALAALYKGAAAFVFPSWVEGFGIPLLEAMSCRTPDRRVRSRVHPRVAGSAARIVDAEEQGRAGRGPSRGADRSDGSGTVAPSGSRARGAIHLGPIRGADARSAPTRVGRSGEREQGRAMTPRSTRRLGRHRELEHARADDRLPSVALGRGGRDALG